MLLAVSAVLNAILLTYALLTIPAVGNLAGTGVFYLGTLRTLLSGTDHRTSRPERRRGGQAHEVTAVHGRARGVYTLLCVFGLRGFWVTRNSTPGRQVLLVPAGRVGEVVAGALLPMFVGRVGSVWMCRVVDEVR